MLLDVFLNENEKIRVAHPDLIFLNKKKGFCVFHIDYYDEFGNAHDSEMQKVIELHKNGSELFIALNNDFNLGTHFNQMQKIESIEMSDLWPTDADNKFLGTVSICITVE